MLLLCSLWSCQRRWGILALPDSSHVVLWGLRWRSSSPRPFVSRRQRRYCTRTISLSFKPFSFYPSLRCPSHQLFKKFSSLKTARQCEVNPGFSLKCFWLILICSRIQAVCGRLFCQWPTVLGTVASWWADPSALSAARWTWKIPSSSPLFLWV